MFARRMILMHIEPRLLVFTKGVRWRIAGAVGIGLLAVGLGIARLGLLGWLIGQVFAGRPISELVPSILLFAVIAFVDLPVATVMLGFALVALLAPALWHKWDVKNSRRRQTAYASFAAEFLDSIQGLATLKAFGQGKTRADKLEVEARD